MHAGNGNSFYSQGRQGDGRDSADIYWSQRTTSRSDVRCSSINNDGHDRQSALGDVDFGCEDEDDGDDDDGDEDGYDFDDGATTAATAASEEWYEVS